MLDVTTRIIKLHLLLFVVVWCFFLRSSTLRGPSSVKCCDEMAVSYDSKGRLDQLEAGASMSGFTGRGCQYELIYEDQPVYYNEMVSVGGRYMYRKYWSGGLFVYCLHSESGLCMSDFGVEGGLCITAFAWCATGCTGHVFCSSTTYIVRVVSASVILVWRGFSPSLLSLAIYFHLTKSFLLI